VHTHFYANSVGILGALTSEMRTALLMRTQLLRRPAKPLGPLTI
jgi:hypothetical protein